MATQKNKILIPVDFSEQSLIALDQAIKFANVNNGAVTILHIVEHSLLSSFFTNKTKTAQYKKEIQKKLDKLVNDNKKVAVNPLETMISEGKAYEEIVATAKKIKAKFIVMAKSESNSFIGSNTLRVVREAPCPVITIKGSVHRPYCKHILLPLDLNKETREKVSKAIDLAKHFQATIHVVAIHTTDDEYLVSNLRGILNQVKHYIDNEGVPCTGEMIHSGDISKSVVNYAKKVKADLIMIMTQQELDFTEYFIGSSAQHIINTSDIPVLSINPSGKEYSYAYSSTALYS